MRLSIPDKKNKKRINIQQLEKKSKKEKIIRVIIQKKENKKKNITDNKYVVFKYKREFKNIAFKIQYKLNQLQRSSDLNVSF